MIYINVNFSSFVYNPTEPKMMETQLQKNVDESFHAKHQTFK